jgi:hypothetical protein
MDSKSVDFWIEYLYILRALYNTQVLVQYQCVDNPAALPPTAVLVPLSAQIPTGLNADFVDVEGLKIIQYRPSITSIREMFQAALFVPMDRIDTIWDDYQAFEQIVANTMVSMAQNLPTIGGMPPPAMLAGVQASKLLTEYSTRWGQSKQGLKELERIYAAVNAYFAPLPLDTSSAETVKSNIFAWRRVLEFEKSNHFKLPYHRFRARMEWVQNQCLLSNVYVSEFWVEKCVWTLTHEGMVQGIMVLESAIREYLAHDVLLRLVLACLHEESGEVSKAQAVFVDSLSHFTTAKKPVPSLLMHYVRFAARCLSKVHARTIFLDHFASGSIHVDARVVCAFAKLELRCFNSAENAQRVLELGKARFSKNGEAMAAFVKTEKELSGNQHESFLVRIDGDSLIAKSMNLVTEAIVQSALMTPSTDINEEVLDVSEEERNFAGIRRPELSKMMSFRPGMDGPDMGPGMENPGGVGKSSLLALIELLPKVTRSTVVDTDVVLSRLQRAELPPVTIGGKRFDEDPQVESMRRQREEKAAAAALKRLLAANEAKDSEDVIIKSDLYLDEESEQREFLSALASNIHRERMNYKRLKLVVSL